jgi:hypothetical protein
VLHSIAIIRYYALAIPSIALSSFLSVLGSVMTGDPARAESVGACLNAFNTIALGALGLLRYQSKMDVHRNAASSLQSLKMQTTKLRDQVRPSQQ